MQRVVLDETGNRSTRMGEGSGGVTDLLTCTALTVRGVWGALLDRTRAEHGVSTVHYAFLMALIALVVALIVSLLGPGVNGLFGSGHLCLDGLTGTTCRVGQVTRVTSP
jgi:Flp pilus assembly pilin Flp